MRGADNFVTDETRYRWSNPLGSVSWELQFISIIFAVLFMQAELPSRLSTYAYCGLPCHENSTMDQLMNTNGGYSSWLYFETCIFMQNLRSLGPNNRNEMGTSHLVHAITYLLVLITQQTNHTTWNLVIYLIHHRNILIWSLTHTITSLTIWHTQAHAQSLIY
jgi:hypothetical protein